MYNVYAMSDDGTKMVASSGTSPMEFDTDLDAWDFIKNVMKNPTHPRFMWIKEASECKSSTT